MIEKDLEKLYLEGRMSELTLFIYGLVLKEQQRLKEAKEIFILILNKMPCFWSAWLELAKLIQSDDI